jgi:hypothetical protein
MYYFRGIEELLEWVERHMGYADRFVLFYFPKTSFQTTHVTFLPYRMGVYEDLEKVRDVVESDVTSSNRATIRTGKGESIVVELDEEKLHILPFVCIGLREFSKYFAFANRGNICKWEIVKYKREDQDMAFEIKEARLCLHSEVERVVTRLAMEGEIYYSYPSTFGIEKGKRELYILLNEFPFHD